MPAMKSETEWAQWRHRLRKDANGDRGAWDITLGIAKVSPNVRPTRVVTDLPSRTNTLQAMIDATLKLCRLTFTSPAKMCV
jgi:hypothetical protein